LLALAPGTASAASLGCADDASGLTDYSASWEAQLLQLTNEHRTGMGLVALQLDTTLTRAAVWKARDMARRDYFAHDDAADAATGAPSRTPWARLEACGWPPNTGSRAENIAAGYSTAQQVITGWLNSPGHRANIENASMRYVGFGVANGASSAYGTYSVQMFASVPGPTATTPISTPPATGTGGGGSQGDDPWSGDPTRETYGSGDGGGGTSASPATAIADPLVRVTRARCRTRQAVRGWCWRIVVRGRVSSAQAAGRTIVVSRRAASGRWVRAASLRSSSTGSFYRSIAIRPPARGTATWLVRNARSYRIAVARTRTASGTTRIATARIARAA
jgi:uncharacterized protein YkwD